MKPFFEGTMLGDGSIMRIDTPDVPWMFWGQPMGIYLKDNAVDQNRITTASFAVQFARQIFHDPIADLDLNETLIAETGDSFYEISMDKIVLQQNAREITVNLIKNANGHLAGLLSSNLGESTFSEAIVCARDAVNSFVVGISLMSNIPCMIGVLRVASTDSCQKYAMVNTTYPTITFPQFQYRNNFPLMEPLLSLYVEGLRDASPFYRLLCFFKISEKITTSINPKIRELAISCNVEAPTLNGVIPDDPFDKIAPSYIGKKYTKILDELRESHRNVIAHLDLNSRIRPFNVATESEVRQGAMVLSFIARDLLIKTYDGLILLRQAGCDFQGVSFS